MEGGRWRVEGGEWRVEGGGWRVEGTPASPGPSHNGVGVDTDSSTVMHGSPSTAELSMREEEEELSIHSLAGVPPSATRGSDPFRPAGFEICTSCEGSLSPASAGSEVADGRGRCLRPWGLGVGTATPSEGAGPPSFQASTPDTRLDRRSLGGADEPGICAFRGGLVFQAHRLLYHSTLGLRVIKKKKQMASPEPDQGAGFRAQGVGCRTQGVGCRAHGGEGEPGTCAALHTRQASSSLILSSLELSEKVYEPQTRALLGTTRRQAVAIKESEGRLIETGMKAQKHQAAPDGHPRAAASACLITDY